MPNTNTLAPTSAGTLIERARAAKAERDAEYAAGRRAQREIAEDDARERLVAMLAAVLGVSVEPEAVRVEVTRDDEYDVSASAYVDVDGLTFTARRDYSRYGNDGGILAASFPCAKCGDPLFERVDSLAHLADMLDAAPTHSEACPRDEDAPKPAAAIVRLPTTAERLHALVVEIARAAARDGAEDA